MSFHYTPGPWQIAPPSTPPTNRPSIIACHYSSPTVQDKRDRIAEILDAGNPEEALANACLIAAAPELLKALEVCCGLLMKWVERGEVHPAVVMARRAMMAARNQGCGLDPLRCSPVAN